MMDIELFLVTFCHLAAYLAPNYTPRVIQQYPSRSTATCVILVVALIVCLARGVKVIHSGTPRCKLSSLGTLVPAAAVAAVVIPMGTRCDHVAAHRRRLPPEHESEIDEVSVGG